MLRKIKETIQFVHAMTNDEYWKYIEKIIAENKNEEKAKQESIKRSTKRRWL